MKNYLFIWCLLPLFAWSQTQVKSSTPIKVEAKKWVKGDNNQPWQFFDTRIVDNLNDYKSLNHDEVNKYGSSTIQQTKASGFFRTEKIANRWWVIDPEGYYNI